MDNNVRYLIYFCPRTFRPFWLPLDQGPYSLLSAPCRAYNLRSVAVYTFRRVLMFVNKCRAIWHSLNSCVLYSGCCYTIIVTYRISVQYKCFGVCFCVYVLGDIYLNKKFNSTKVVLSLNPCRDTCFIHCGRSLRIVRYCIQVGWNVFFFLIFVIY
jgi:hypothetical protein